MEEYLHSLQQHLKDFPAEEQAAIMEEIQSHMESGENDPRMGTNGEQRRDRLMKEMGSPEDLGRGFRSAYRSGRFVDYLLVAIPYALYPLLNMLYLRLGPPYPWLDVRTDILVHLPLVAVGLWRRSPLITLFWITVLLGQLLYIVTSGFWQSYWYFGWQTVLWAVLMAGLLILTALIVWRNRHDLLTVLFALLPLCVLLMGVVLWTIHPTSYTAYNWADRSLLRIFLEIEGRGVDFYALFAVMALIFLPMQRGLRWTGLAAWALLLGLGRAYLLDYETGNLAMLAHWVYYLYVLLPAMLIFLGWRLDRASRHQLELVS